MFPEGRNQGLYHTADATLWFFHALHRYVEHCRRPGDAWQLLLPILKDIVEHHLEGTRFGIGSTRATGCSRQGAEGYQLTWMDAKVGDWVVTPRRGKAVEINALWYNALRLLADWLREAERPGSRRTRSLCERGARFLQSPLLVRGRRLSLRRRRWRERRRCRVPTEPDLRDLARPSGPRPGALGGGRRPRCTRTLLTPVGLRSLAPGDPDYKPRYFGDLRARDAAYHQGTVWAWLIGPFIDAWLKVHPDDRAAARHFLDGFEPHLGEAGIGSISEVFDAEPPFTPRGCIAQAWSVAEVLRCLAKTAEERK